LRLDDRPKDAHDTFSILSETVIDHAAQILTVLPGYSEFPQASGRLGRKGIVKKFAEGTAI
jgi:hypothetical protein